MTAADYIDKHTATESMALLNSTSLSVNHISRMMNSPSSSVFGKFFKRMTGCSPTEYRGENI
jgi:AraC-like DNA-binding protein